MGQSFYGTTPAEVSLSSTEKLKSIGQYLYIYQDSTNALSFQEISSPSFQSHFVKSEKEVPDFGISDRTVWVRLTIRNTSPSFIKDYIEIAFPTLDEVTYYHRSGGGTWHTYFGSDRIAFNERLVLHKNLVFPLLVEPKKVETVFFKIKNKGSIILPVNITPQSELYKDDLAEEIIYGIFYGIMLVMLIYNLLLAFTARSITYLFYVGIIAGNLLTLSALNGHAFQYLWANYPWWANHVIIFGIGLWILSGNLFAASFLEIKNQSKAFLRAFQLMQLLGLLIIICTFTLDYSDSLLIANLGLILNCFFLLIMGLTFWLRGLKIAGIFSLAWVLYLTGVLLYTLRNLGWLPVNDVTTHILEIGAISEVLLLSVSLGYKYRLLEFEKEQAQQDSIDLMARSQELVKQQNELLEKSIEERTLELQNKQQEVLEQNARLNDQNQQLLNAQEIIKQQNDELQRYNENLEEKVSQRTADLKDTNHKLAENVQKLEQYAFMTAHNLRAPVARLLGLTQLLELDPKASKRNWMNILSKVKEEGKSLDSIINDLNAILELRKNKKTSTEEVDLESVLTHVQKILKETVEKTEAEITIDLQEWAVLEANRTYMENIFYNLISNAIKYRLPDTQPKINIRTYFKQAVKVIEVRDEGIGIDLKRHKGELFGMYKRFNTHTDGKGLGLFLVKSQVEIMGGRIQVQSEIGKGTTFRLLFK